LTANYPTPQQQPAPQAYPQTPTPHTPIAMQGPGPLDLATGHDRMAEVQFASTIASAPMVAQSPSADRSVPTEVHVRHEPSDAELDKWVEQQERAEAKRERALAKAARAEAELAKSEPEFPSDEDFAAEEPSEDQPPRTGWLARIRSLWPFGNRAESSSELYELGPSDEFDELDRTARGQRELPANGSSTWR
jgi:hypothetical protein